jgi:hypothetical protein
MGGTGLMLAVRPGRYTCVHDEVKTEVGEARRCRLRRMDKGDRSAIPRPLDDGPVLVARGSPSRAVVPPRRGRQL